MIAPGEQCLIAVRYASGSDAGLPSGDIGVEYADAVGPSPEHASLRILVFPPSPSDAGADGD